jgi:uncharacterized membrane protein
MREMPETNRWLRLARHRWWDESQARRTLGTAALKTLEARVGDSERRHSGEIRICIEAGLPLGYLWRNATARERAVALFGKLRVWDTEANNGVLIYLLMADRAVEIVADRGVDRLVSPAQWRAIVQAMQGDFGASRFEAGLNAALDAVDRLLSLHFPLAAGQADTNELPDAPIVI